MESQNIVPATTITEALMLIFAHMKIICRKLLAFLKPLLPLCIGISVGLSLSVIIKVIFIPSCQSGHFLPGEHLPSSEKQLLKEQTEHFLYGKLADYSVKLIQNTNDEPPAINSNKPHRPRYAATELGIREKLFVGILTSAETIDTFGVALNKTVVSHLPKLVYFLNKKTSALPQGLSVVIFPNEEKRLVPYHMFKYIQDHYLNAFDFYYFVTDNTYVRASNVLRLVKHISVIHDIYMGVAADDNGLSYCSLSKGMLLSQSVVAKVVDQLDWCLGQISQAGASDSIAKCVEAVTHLQCMSRVGDLQYRSYESTSFEFDRDIETASKNASFQDVLTVENMMDEVQTFKLHRFYSENDIKQTKKLLSKTEEELVHYAQESPAGLDSYPWPRGVDVPVLPKTRFDVIRWEYFTESVIFEKDDFQNMVELKGVDKQDIQEVIKFSMDQFNKKYNNQFLFISLFNGYRRFDPVRGMEYIVDLTLRNKSSNSIEVKRAHLLRPLSYAEIIPMPYVTEGTLVTLILPVLVGQQDDVIPFLDTYAHSCVDAGENAHLFILFVYNSDFPQTGAKDIFSVVKNMLKFYDDKYKGNSKMSSASVQHNKPNVFYMMDTISKKFAKETLFMLCTLGMDLSTELLNRIRMNTIAGWQVFFPIGFWQYKPNLIYEEKPYPTEIEVSGKTGRFDKNDFSHASFYSADYQYARRQMVATSSSQNIELMEMFLKYHSIHVFRAAEPALKHRFQYRDCVRPKYDVDMAGPLGEAYQRCLHSRAECLNSRSQLAMLLFKHQHKVDKGQLDVMHAQQQKRANVEQMEPNMLK